MTHEERAERRARAAGMVRGGMTAVDVARSLGMGYTTVLLACVEAGVKTGAPPMRAAASFRILAAMMNGPDRALVDIAREFCVSPQRVSQIRAAARDAGIPGIDR